MGRDEISPLVAIVMGSKSDWDTMQHADAMLTQFSVPHECRIVSAHRTPQLLAEFALEASGRGLQVIIAGAGARLTCQGWWRPIPSSRCLGCLCKATP